MDTNSIAMSAVSSCLPLIPLLLVWVVGIVLAITRWQRHPKVSLLALIALVVVLLESILNGFLNVLTPVMYTEMDLTPTQIGTFYTIWSIIAAIVNTIVWGLILAAIFRWRDDLIPPVPGG